MGLTMALSAGVGVRTLVSANAETRCDLEGRIAAVGWCILVGGRATSAKSDR